MVKGRTDRERSAHGWFKSGEHSYEGLLKSKSVLLLVQTLTPSSKAGHLYQLKHFLDLNKLTPEKLLKSSDIQIKEAVKNAVLHKQQKKSFAASRKMFYIVRRFLEINGREVTFNRTERNLLLKREPKKVGREHVPTREELYRMVDSFPDKGPLQKKRGKALILCLWQSGVRVNCLCSWMYGIFKKQLYPELNIPIAIKVVANRPEGVYDCAVDTKLSSYAVNYYYTFLPKEGAEVLRDYLEERKKHGWTPKDNDPIFVTHGTVAEENGKPVTAHHVIEVVKNAAEQIGIPRQSIWTHCLRKAFRKTLYASGVDPDMAEALMGHKLGASKTSYFDYHDVEFARKIYEKCNWSRVDIGKIEAMEQEIVELRKAKQELETLKQNGQQKTSEIEDLKIRLSKMEEIFNAAFLEIRTRKIGEIAQHLPEGIQPINLADVDRATAKAIHRRDEEIKQGGTVGNLYDEKKHSKESAERKEFFQSHPELIKCGEGENAYEFEKKVMEEFEAWRKQKAKSK